ncbi:MAG: GNAT family N-acetyltransferase [Spirochaetales bacterium]|nr:GNAT family N-acetyltransferase [Spirochaetales bacterium]
MKENQVVIEPANIDDLPGILNLYGIENFDKSNVRSGAERIFNEMKNHPRYSVYVARVDEKIAGTFFLSIKDNQTSEGKAAGLVEDVVVSEEMRLKGIGRKMIQHAMKICSENNCYKMCLSSQLKKIRARKFYKRIGFRIHRANFTLEPQTA